MSATQIKNRRVVLIAVVVVLGMFGFGFVLVPIYNVFSDAFGFNGRVATNTAGSNQAGVVTTQVAHEKIDKSRKVTLQFVVIENHALDLEFRPLIRQVSVNPGEVKEVAYYVKNLSDREVVLQAIPSVLPGAATKYLTKVGSFTNEILKPGEAKTIPLKVIVESGIPKKIEIVTLSYRFIDVTPAASAEQDVKKSEIQVAALVKELI